MCTEGEKNITVCTLLVLECVKVLEVRKMLLPVSVGMICLMMYVRHFSPLIQKEDQNLSLCTSISTLTVYFPWFLSVALTLAMSQVYDYSFLLSLIGAPTLSLDRD